MDPTIIAGDYILVNKLLLGPRIYENLSFLKYTKTKMKRIWKWHNVKRNDILVFDFPYKWYAPNKIIQGGNLFYVKRCIAIPGDTFCIDNGVYKVKDINGNLGNIEKHSNLSQIESNSLIFNKRFRDIFPKDTTYFRWTIKNFGPLYIPAKDDNLSFDSISIKLYKNLIEYETEKIISIKNGIIYLGDSIINKYTFLQNYYFVAGDFISASEDSRYWGLLPDDLVVGKAVVIWKSQDIITGKYRWNRFLKTIK
jgi:signal peptidase I